MDDKKSGSVGDFELADQAGGGVFDTNDRRDMTRDEGEMAFYGKKAQLKVRVLETLATANPQH